MLKRIIIAVSAGIILAALMIPALAGHSITDMTSIIAVDHSTAVAVKDISPAQVKTR